MYCVPASKGSKCGWKLTDSALVSSGVVHMIVVHHLVLIEFLIEFRELLPLLIVIFAGLLLEAILISKRRVVAHNGGTHHHDLVLPLLLVCLHSDVVVH